VAHHPHGAEQIDVEHAADLRLVDVLEVPAGLDAGDVHHPIEAARGLDDRLQGGGNRRLVVDVELHGVDRDATLARGIKDRRVLDGAARAGEHAKAALGQAQGGLEPEAARGSRHQHAVAFLDAHGQLRAVGPA